MKLFLLLCPFIFFAVTGHTQIYKVNKCIIEKGILKTVVADYDPATGNSYVTVNGARKDFEQIYPATAKDYAINTPWFKTNNIVTFNGQRYIKYGLPRVLATTEIKKSGEYNAIGVYTEIGLIKDAEVIYLPVQRGCEFQPYQKALESVTKKIYYDEDWRVTTANYAAYYRLVTLDETGKPKGLVTDYYISGEKQWQGYVTYMDPEDNNFDVTEGLCTWFYKNGKKAAEVTKLEGREHGIYKTWTEDGKLESEKEYKYGILHGPFKTWFADGKPAILQNYADGLLDGKQIQYLPDGRMSLNENFVAGNPVKPCYTMLQEDNSILEVCTEVFSQQKNVFPWKYSVSSATKHFIDSKQGLQLKSSPKSKTIAFFDFAKDPKAIQSIYTEFTVNAEDKDAEYGLVWNYTDSSNFNYLMMSKDGWWSAGSFIKGQRGAVVKMNRDELWNHQKGGTQSITVSLFDNSVEFSLNGNPFYTTDASSGFFKKGLGVICLDNTSVYFKKFETLSRKQ
jgi:antitoxin component YwqK of YwqJK toxin-antitoxin module